MDGHKVWEFLMPYLWKKHYLRTRFNYLNRLLGTIDLDKLK